MFDEKKILDFVHVNDVCRAVELIFDRLDVVAGELINVGSGEGTPLPAVARQISKEIDGSQGWTVAPNRSGDVVRYVSNISKTKSLLGYEPATGFEEGIHRTIDWFLDRPELLHDIRDASTASD